MLKGRRALFCTGTDEHGMKASAEDDPNLTVSDRHRVFRFSKLQRRRIPMLRCFAIKWQASSRYYSSTLNLSSEITRTESATDPCRTGQHLK